MLAVLGPVGYWAAIALMASAIVAFAGWVLLRPPRSAQAVAWRLAVGYAAVIVLAPATRFGYFAYPLGLLAWLALAKSLSSEQTAAPSQDHLLISGG
jgi:hypothetical protein